MRRIIGLGLLVTMIVAVPILEVHAQNKKGPAKPAGQVIDSANLPAGEYAGTVKNTPGSDRAFTLVIETPKAAGGKGGNQNANRILQAQQRIQQLQLQLARARTPQQAAQIQRQIQQQMTQLQRTILQAQGKGAGKVAMVKNEVDFQAKEKVKVRTMFLPEQFDEKGNPKQYTNEEKALLKGKDKNLPGYESSLEKLEPGQVVKVILVTARPAAKDKDEEKANIEKRMQVSTILILQEGTGQPQEKGRPKKKKK